MVCAIQEEKAIVRSIFRLNKWGFPPRLEYIMEAILLLKQRAQAWNFAGSLGQHYISQLLARHPDVAFQFTTSIEADGIKVYDPKLIQLQFTRVQQVYQFQNEWSHTN